MTTTEQPDPESGGFNTQPPPVPSPPIVTQDELRRYRSLARHRRDAEQLRKSILERLNAGASVECGPLTARIEERRVRQVTRASLEEMWGQHYVQGLRQHLPETVQRQLKVLDQSSETEI